MKSIYPTLAIVGALIGTAITKLHRVGKTYGMSLSQTHRDYQLRRDLSERQIDKMVADSFPASDSPSTY